MLAVCNGWFAHAIMPSVSNPVPFMMQRAVALLPVVRHGFLCIFSAPEKPLLKFRSRHILFSIYMCSVISSASPFHSPKVFGEKKGGRGEFNLFFRGGLFPFSVSRYPKEHFMTRLTENDIAGIEAEWATYERRLEELTGDDLLTLAARTLGIDPEPPAQACGNCG